MRKSIYLGVLAYAGCSAETLQDYMRFAFYLGRRCQDYDFFLSVISKKEQFRARNEIVEASITMGSAYLLMLDDDHILDIANTARPAEVYDFLRKQVKYMEENPKVGIIGSLYWQRDGVCRPVAMRKGDDEKFYWIKKEEIENKLQPADVIGGGCMMINTKIFDRISSPWFVPEFDAGTDIQICAKTKEQGFEIMWDTSFEIGHVRNAREIITSTNARDGEVNTSRIIDRMSDDWAITSMMYLYNSDIEEYLKMTPPEINDLAKDYEKNRTTMVSCFQNPDEYYRNLGPEQIARQYWYHNQPEYATGTLMRHTLNVLNGKELRGLDFGCGTSPIGFEMARYEHHMDFVDIDGAPAYEFTKWRVKRRELKNVGWKIKGPYDFVLMFDIIEHLKNWQEILKNIIDKMKDGGHLITNYFILQDWVNPEHINKDQESIRELLVSNKIYPINVLVWRKYGSPESGVRNPL